MKTPLDLLVRLACHNFLVAMQRCKAVCKTVMSFHAAPVKMVVLSAGREFLPLVITVALTPFAEDFRKHGHYINDLCSLWDNHPGGAYEIHVKICVVADNLICGVY